jgi:hypothetical protein
MVGTFPGLVARAIGRADKHRRTTPSARLTDRTFGHLPGPPEVFETRRPMD